MCTLSKFCITKGYTIRETLSQIEENHNRAVIVVDDGGRACGLVSQGDIIRALAAGADLFSNVAQFASPSFTYLKSRDYGKAFDLMKRRGMTVFPVLDDDFKLIDVLTAYDVLEHVERLIGNE